MVQSSPHPIHLQCRGKKARAGTAHSVETHRGTETAHGTEAQCGDHGTEAAHGAETQCGAQSAHTGVNKEGT